MPAHPGIFYGIWIRIMKMNLHLQKRSDYWNQVDVYIGGTEHAVGHLLYSRYVDEDIF